MKKAFKRALEVYQHNERHDTVAETRYWCDQYKLLATKAIEKLQQCQPMTGWQLIETAPKDSTSILIYCPRSERKPVFEAWWAIAFEGSHQGHWQTPIGPNGRGYTILETSPTHWMPLPVVPQGSDK